MNLDELYNTVISADRQIYAPVSSSSSTTDAASVPRNYNLNGAALMCKTDYNLNGGELICKTDDEMWRETVRQEEQQCSDEKPVIFDQTTLEDFLFRAGATNLGVGRAEGESQPLLDPVVRQHADWMDYQLVADQQQQQRMALLRSNMPVFGNGAMNGRFTESQQMEMPETPLISMGMVRPTSSDLLTSTETNRPDENVDKSIERRQKRMIKNRESAARSRAKKQAYINHLEEAANKLSRENEWLRKQKEVEEMLSHFIAIPEPKYQLRRTSSWSF